MNLAWGLTNLWDFSLQAGLLVLAGGLLLDVFRIRDPRVRLAYWQALLAACFVLPLVQPWEIVASVPYSTGQAGALVAGGVAASWRFEEPLVLVLLTGFVCRLLWLSIGAVRLRRHRRQSRSWEHVPSWVGAMQSRIGVTARIRIAPDLDGPVTFGLRQPVILLPTRFERMSREVQGAILAHELLHVRRKDWVWTCFEELVRSTLWFHPAMVWLIARIQLAREQVVDRLAVQSTESRDAYLEALLEITKGRLRPVAGAAPAFLRRRQLAQRVALLLREDSMSRFRFACSLSAILALLLTTAYFGVTTFPLRAAAQKDKAGSEQKVHRVGNGVRAPKLVEKVEPEYTEEASDAGLEGTVILSVIVGPDDRAHTIKVKRSLGMGLDEKAIDAVEQWRFEPAMKKGKAVAVEAMIEVNFRWY